MVTRSRGWRDAGETGHRSVLDAATALMQAAQVEQVATRLDALGAVVRTHFADEEGPGGLFDRIVEVHPGAQPSVDVFVAEHREILASVDALRSALRDVGGGDAAEVERLRARLVERIRSHEARESRLLAEVTALELGGPGGG